MGWDGIAKLVVMYVYICMYMLYVCIRAGENVRFYDFGFIVYICYICKKKNRMASEDVKGDGAGWFGLEHKG